MQPLARSLPQTNATNYPSRPMAQRITLNTKCLGTGEWDNQIYRDSGFTHNPSPPLPGDPSLSFAPRLQRFVS